MDRQVGEVLLRYLLYGTEPKWELSRLEASRDILFEDLKQKEIPGVTVRRKYPVCIYDSVKVIAPIYIARPNGGSVIVDVSGALTPGVPADSTLAELIDIQ